MYPLIKPLLFKLEPETAHKTALNSLQIAYQLKLTKLFAKSISHPINVMNMTFANPIGLAAGMDKNGDYIDALAALGFGFIEIGTLTPKPQIGNAKPRLFRLAKHESLINCLGFNNKGIDYAANKLANIQYRGVLGINIGKNKDTPLDQAVNDYLLGFRKLWKFASYITINISSPNTVGLRDLQHQEHLDQLLASLKHEQSSIQQQHDKYVPLVVKISPDLNPHELHEAAEVFLQQNIDGVIASNTTIDRSQLANTTYATLSGGLSGKLLDKQNTNVVAALYSILQNRIPIIASGGVSTIQSMKEKIDAGANLIQIYTGFIYHGPKLIPELAKYF